MYLFNYQPVAIALYDALNTNPVYQAFEQSVANDTHAPMSAKDAMLAYFDYSLKEAEQYGDVTLLDGDAVGATIWSKPIGESRSIEKTNRKNAFIQQYMGDDCFSMYTTIGKFMEVQLDGLITPESWYLSIIGIAPTFQGQGLGRSLMTPILTQTDQLGVPTYLETYNPRNKRFYNRLGYVEIAAFDEPVTGKRYWGMQRTPTM
ncbi:MAG: GNAT family N-acetyltransferase [Chloroflexota bacterium]